MSFIGSINGQLRQFFFTHARILEGRKCYIGCSGNFTIEQIISRRCQLAEIFSNDVSLYSTMLGYALTGRHLPVEVTNPEILWANEYMRRDAFSQVACTLLLLEMFEYEKQNNAFKARMWQSYLVNFAALFEKTLARVKKAAENIRIKEYTAIDVFDYFPRPDGVSIGFLPTYVGGYEKLFKRLEESVEWDAPKYKMLTTERREETIRKMTEGEYVLYDDTKRSDLPCVARVDMFGKKTVFIYSNLDFKKGLFRRKFNEQIVPYKILMPEEEIRDTDTITIKEISLPVINHYRNLYLSKKIEPGSGGPCFLVFAGEKLFGFLIFQVYSKKGGPSSQIYLLSDFVVPSSRYNRLAKLLLLVTKTQEMQRILEEGTVKKYESILTTAFTEKPVSMKYRGTYELVKRGQGFLNYEGKFDNTRLNEVIPLWKKKYSKP